MSKVEEKTQTKKTVGGVFGVKKSLTKRIFVVKSIFFKKTPKLHKSAFKV